MSNKLNVEMAKILTQPIVPLALHYLAPRKIMGPSEWNRLKKEYREKADHHCMICGNYVSHKPGDWLELHEMYDYNFVDLTQTLTGYVSICHSCHMYIHQGLLNIQLQQGKIDQNKYDEIEAHGDKILEEFGLRKIRYPSREILISPDWKLVFKGKSYQNSSYEPPIIQNKENVKPSLLKKKNISLTRWKKAYISFFTPLNIIRQIYILISGYLLFKGYTLLIALIFHFNYKIVFITLRFPEVNLIDLYMFLGFLISPAIFQINRYLKKQQPDKYYNPNYENASADQRLNWDIHVDIMKQQEEQNQGILYLILKIIGVYLSALFKIIFFPLYLYKYNKLISN